MSSVSITGLDVDAEARPLGAYRGGRSVRVSTILAASGTPPMVRPVDTGGGASDTLPFLTWLLLILLPAVPVEVNEILDGFALAAVGSLCVRPVAGREALGSVSLAARFALIFATFVFAASFASFSSAICFDVFSPDLRPRYPTQLEAPHLHSTRFAPSDTPKASKL